MAGAPGAPRSHGFYQLFRMSSFTRRIRFFVSDLFQKRPSWRGAAVAGPFCLQKSGEKRKGEKKGKEKKKEPLRSFLGPLPWIYYLKDSEKKIFKKREVPDNLWLKCPACDSMIFHTDAEESLFVCPECDFHLKVSAETRFSQLFEYTYI